VNATIEDPKVVQFFVDAFLRGVNKEGLEAVAAACCSLYHTSVPLKDSDVSLRISKSPGRNEDDEDDDDEDDDEEYYGFFTVRFGVTRSHIDYVKVIEKYKNAETESTVDISHFCHETGWPCWYHRDLADLLTRVAYLTDEQWEEFYHLVGRLKDAMEDHEFAIWESQQFNGYGAVFACMGLLPIEILAGYLSLHPEFASCFSDYAALFPAINFTDEQWEQFDALREQLQQGSGNFLDLSLADKDTSAPIVFACMGVLPPVHIATCLADRPDFFPLFEDYLHLLHL
jgi:hypothetical protein